MLRLLWLHALGLPLYGLYQGFSALHALLEGGVVALLALAGRFAAERSRPRVAAALVSLGLITSSAVLVHLSGGYIEAHFHFFVMIIVLSLYEDWLPFLLAFAYVVVHHGLAGVFSPDAVYNHPDAIEHPWRWALIHGAFVSAAGAAALVTWKHNELSRERAADADARAQERSEHARELKRSEEATRRIIDSAYDVYIQIDEQSVVTAWNAQAERTFGYVREEAVGQDLPGLIIPARFHEQHRQGLARFLATGEGAVLGTRLELVAQRKDGRELPIEITISALEGHDGKYRFHAFLHDITRRKLVEERMQHAQDLERRQRQAYELNDSVVQRLAVANLAFAMGRAEQAGEAVSDALNAAKRIINEWAGESPDQLQRREPALPQAPGAGGDD